MEKNKTKRVKPFFTANVRDILDQLRREEISYNKMIELLNEIARDFYDKQKV